MRIHPKAYSRKFLSHLETFITSHRGSCPKQVALAVSGGVDSMALLHAVSHLREKLGISQLRVFHIHHGSRAGQDEDERLVRETATAFGLECEVAHLDGKQWKDNFESRAREARYAAFQQWLKVKEELWMAHHLDDSFEWTQMQSARSGNYQSCLGIPLKNGAVFRPFLCLSKKQILVYAKTQGLEWNEDPSNQNLNHERNYWRQEVIPLIQQRHPKCLKHYAYRSQELAEKLGLSLKKQTAKTYFFTKASLVVGATTSTGELRPLVHLHSTKKRGEIERELGKILLAQKNHKMGPFSLSGGVKVYMQKNSILVTAPDFYFGESYENSQMKTMITEKSWQRWKSLSEKVKK